MHESVSGVYGEIQPGSYLFLDRDYADNEPPPGAPRFEHSLFIKSQVMSLGTSHAVVDVRSNDIPCALIVFFDGEPSRA